MKTTIETLTFPCEVIDKIKIKTSFRNLSIRFVNGHIIKFNKTNLSIREPHKIIITQDTIVSYFVCKSHYNIVSNSCYFMLNLDDFM